MIFKWIPFHWPTFAIGKGAADNKGNLHLNTNLQANHADYMSI